MAEIDADKLAKIKDLKEAVNKLYELCVENTKGFIMKSNINISIVKYDKKPENDKNQYHHLNQDAAYKSIIPKSDGVCTALEGNAFSQPGTPHYIVHYHMEEFWNQYRRNGDKYGKKPTNLEYSTALAESLEAAGYDRNESLYLTESAIRDQLEHNLRGEDTVPRVPNPIGQKKVAK